MGTKEYSFKTYAETYENSAETYVAYDQDGKAVSFKKKSRSHQSQHQIYQHPTFFENLPIVIQQPHIIVINPKSQNPNSIREIPLHSAFSALTWFKKIQELAQKKP